MAECSDSAFNPTVADTRPLPIANLPLLQFMALLESLKSGLAVMHGAGTDSALDSVFKE
jgi:hypothetical protein